jgi:hypothetical protein
VKPAGTAGPVAVLAGVGDLPSNGAKTATVCWAGLMQTRRVSVYGRNRWECWGYI